MFKKKPTIKPLAPLRSSDRRRTADQIISAYGLRPPQEDTSVDDAAATATELSSLRKSLLPDDVQTARFTTTHGPDLKQVSGTVYVGALPGDEPRVLWFKIEDRLYPSVYTLWKHPGILPLLHTPELVVNKLRGGADLMTPGLANGPPFPEQAKKGAIVVVASLEKPSVPVTIGVCEIDISALGSVQGSRGHAVQTLHWAGDELWSYSTSDRGGVEPPEHIEGWQGSSQGQDDLSGQTSELQIEDEDEDGGVALGDADVPPGDAPKDVDSTQEETAPSTEMTTKEIDDAFRKAFVYGIHHYKETNKGQPNFGLDFPLSQSFAMSNLVQPFLPAFTPDEANSLQIKKSSFKNIKKLIKSFDKEKLLRSRERDGHETTIIDIDFEDAAIVGFKPYRLPKKETASGTSQGRGGKDTVPVDTGDSSVGQRLEKVEVYKPKEKLLPLFSTPGRLTQTYFAAAEVRAAVTQYIESEKLISPTNKRLVSLNPTLANAVFDGSTYLDKEVLAKGTVPRDALIDRVLSCCSPHYTISRNGEASDKSSKPKAGSAPKVRITLETRSGNKTVTKVSGVEPYYISPQRLADELRKVCAGSTSVEQLAGSSPKSALMEIMIQGPQKDAVIKALERRGVRSGWVEFLDKTKGKKR